MTIEHSRHYKNLAWIFSVEIFWGVSMALVSNVAIIPVFLTHLGASNSTVTMLPVLFLLATGIPGMFAAHVTGKMVYRKRFVIVAHVVSAIPWFAMAAWFLFAPRLSPAADIAAILLGWGIAWIWMGFLIPVWINFIGKVTRPELRARSFGIIFFFQTLMGAIGGWVASHVIGSGLPFPANYGLGFAIGGAFMAVGSFFFLPVVEEPGPISEEQDPLRGIARHTREILTDRGGVRAYLSIYMLCAGWPILTTFYPIWAERRFGLAQKDSAIYTAVFMVGNMVGSLGGGAIGDRHGYAKVCVIATLSFVAGLVAALAGGSVVFYYVTALLLGIYVAADRLALYNLSMAFSPHDDNTAYLGLIPALTLPALVLGAAVLGPSIDAFGFEPVASVALALAALATFLAIFRLPEPRYSLAGRRKP